jgi:spermidine/putrescine transport system substrate-binding protein
MADRTENTLSELEMLTRRRLLRRAGGVAALAALPGFLAACGSDNSSSGSTSTASSGGSTTTAAKAAAKVAGTITMMNYPDWIGSTEVKTFEAAFPDAKVKQVSGLTEGAAQAIAQINQNKDSYDMSLGAMAVAGQLAAAKLLAPVEVANVPSLAKVPEVFRTAYPWGVPVDLGKTGFAYRKDLISERPTSWADVWKLAPKYSGKVTFIKYDVDVLGSALKYVGKSVNSADPADLGKAKDALLEIKPHLRAFLPTDFAKPLLQGTAVIAMDYDYDVALAQAKNPNVVWVAPEEGTPAYLDGWLALAGSKNLATVYAFMEHHLDPKVYANYINTIGSAYVYPDAEAYIKKSIKDNPSLKYDPSQLQTVEFEKFIGPEGSALRAKTWEQVLAA